MVDSCHLSQMLFSLIDLLLQRSPDKPWLHSRLMASWSRNRRPGQKVGQRTKAIRRASSLQQRNEVQARPSTLLLEYSEQCSAHGSLLPMDEQLHWSFQLQVFPAISCIHSCVSQHGMFCYVEFRLRLSICAWHNSNYPWVRWPGWIACCGTDSLLRLSPVDAVQEFDHYRVLWKVGTGKLHLALWHGSLGQPTKCSGRKCHALVSASPLHTRRWNNISKSRFPAKMIRAKLELVSCRLRILHGPNLPKCQTHWQWTWRMSVWSVADRESTPMHDGGKRQTDPVQVSCSASEWYDNFVWTCVAKPKRSMGTSRIAQESSRVKVKGHDLFLEAWTHGQWLSRTFLSLPRFQNDANSWSLTRQWPLRDFSVNTPIASFVTKAEINRFYHFLFLDSRYVLYHIITIIIIVIVQKFGQFTYLHTHVNQVSMFFLHPGKCFSSKWVSTSNIDFLSSLTVIVFAWKCLAYLGISGISKKWRHEEYLSQQKQYTRGFPTFSCVCLRLWCRTANQLPVVLQYVPVTRSKMTI